MSFYARSLTFLQTRLFCAYFVVVIGLVGCADKPEGSLVKGNVTFDGQPLQTGVIRFAAVDLGSQPTEAQIASGQFEAMVATGQKRVEIRSPKVTGKKKVYNTPDSPTIDTVVELLPAKYNANSELTITVEGAEQVQNFDLKSK
jgi:hypothetical protein